MNILALDQLGKSFWRALETEARSVEAHDGENLPTDLEAEIVAPLQVLGSVRKGQAKLANCVGVHGVFGRLQSNDRHFGGCDRLVYDLITNSKAPLPPQPPHQCPYVFRVPL